MIAKFSAEQWEDIQKWDEGWGIPAAENTRNIKQWVLSDDSTDAIKKTSVKKLSNILFFRGYDNTPPPTTTVRTIPASPMHSAAKETPKDTPQLSSGLSLSTNLYANKDKKKVESKSIESKSDSPLKSLKDPLGRYIKKIYKNEKQNPS